ncbi:MAG: MFS transporter [Promethearchaeota archaeon]|nr:MAG: MFS transporter [Candidatus Lokiarchaeota archaeon]
MKKNHEEIIAELDSKELLEQRRQTTMALSVKEGSFAGLSMVLGDSYITPFALAIGASAVHIGIMNSISGLVLPLGQIIGSRMMVRRSRKTLLTRYVMLQAMMWFFIIGTGILFWFDTFRIVLPLLLMICVFLYQFFGGMVGPAWVSLMGDIIPESERGRYFGKRNSIVNFVALTVTIGVAFLLQLLNTIDRALLGFLIIFALASIMRFISGGCFRYHYNPPFHVDMHDHITFRQFVKTLRTENFGIFTLFMNLISFAQWIAGPFFGVYMLQILQFNYSTYILIILSSSLFSLFFFKVMGRFADSYGNRQLLKFGAFLIPFSPLLWVIFSTPLSLVFGAQLVSGLGWTAFNLASANFIYDNVPASKRGEYMAYYSLIVGVGIVLGGLVGSGIMFLLPFTSVVNYKILFALSGILRAIVVIILFPKLKEVRVTNKYVFNPRNAPLFRWLLEWRFKEKNRNGKTPANNDHNP